MSLFYFEYDNKWDGKIVNEKEIVEILDEANRDVDAEGLIRFARRLEEWNRTHNLSGAKDIHAVWRHIEDALGPLSFVEKPDSLLDVGTGAGFPGLVLAIAWRESEIVLTEPIKKRAAFLKYVCADLGLKHVRVVSKRVEEIVHPPFALITSRAVTDTKMLLNLTQHVSDAQTHYLFYKGSRAEEEATFLGNQYDYDIVRKGKRHYLYIKGRK